MALPHGTLGSLGPAAAYAATLARPVSLAIKEAFTLALHNQAI